MTTFLNRETSYSILPLLLSRVSYRAFREERLTEEELMSLFEAARWAPSSFNNQPWRFLYARRGEEGWNPLFESLIDFNKQWCATADTLVLVVSRNTFEHNEKPSATASFDTGSAWMSLALEATNKKLIAHAMQGFDHDAVRTAFRIPPVFTVEVMIAIGKPGDPLSLPPELREKEVPSLRKPLAQIVSQAIFPFE